MAQKGRQEGRGAWALSLSLRGSRSQRLQLRRGPDPTWQYQISILAESLQNDLCSSCDLCDDGSAGSSLGQGDQVLAASAVGEGESFDVVLVVGW